MGLLTWLTMRRCAIALTLLPVVSGQTLFFSQYQEASSGNNKYFQIYNPTDAAIDLANDYSIAMCSNGCGSGPAFESGFAFASGATISAGGTYLVCHSSMDGDTSACDETSSSTIVGFNGDDFRALISGTDHSTATAADIVDQIGLFSETDPGSYWPVCGSDSGIETRNSLLLRVTTTCAGENDGASFEDSFSGTCAWTSQSQETTPYTWTASGSCTSSGSTPGPSALPIPAPTAPTPLPIPTPTITSACSTSQYWSGYDFSSLSAAEIRTALLGKIDEHTALPYTSSSSTDVWDALEVLDADPSDSSNVILIYGQTSVSKDAHTDSDGWNREHVWPKSYGIGTSGDDYTDVHNLRACDWSVNSARGNLFFGECDPSLDSSCSSPAHSEAASDTAANSVLWMPPAAVRGDIARTLFYMEVRGDCYFVHLVAKVTPCCLTLA